MSVEWYKAICENKLLIKKIFIRTNLSMIIVVYKMSLKRLLLRGTRIDGLDLPSYH